MSAIGGISAAPLWTRALSGQTPAVVVTAGQGGTATNTTQPVQPVNPYGVNGQGALGSGPAAVRSPNDASQSGGGGSTTQAAAGKGTAADGSKLTDAQQQQVDKLKAVDRAVRAHEAAHKAAGGPYAGSETFSFSTGPDGQHYATAGEVSIDIGSVQGDPQATITKLETVRRAALAPADPSGQDRAVAAQAEAGIVAAQGQEAKQTTGNDGGDGRGAAAAGVGLGGITSRQGAAAYRKGQGALDASIVQAAQAAAQPQALIV
ncbi:putative metalloprotease CJM1_0395 family protein [Nitrospirillum iridis]|uniref:SprA-related family protein n=1 Tax=Nitrospirillum iridis TaxID=765888 RepID=A0A7X0AX57_9PROT|nr:putative metalloprotease CJM1_0395 family protein [Nitrospirillum iridis]MBB6251357.1 hypothetical protein [Nitrospirillum iridis]